MGSALRASDHRTPFLSSIDRAKLGDPVAINELIAECLPHIASYVRRRGSGDPEALSNVVALEFVSSLDRLDFGSDGQAWSYIYRICRSRLVDEHRRSASERSQCPLDDRDLPPTQLFEQDVVDRLWVDDALQELTDEQRRVVELRFLNDLSIAETAERTGKSTMAVKGLQRRALRHLAGVVLFGAMVLAVTAAVQSAGPARNLPQIQTGGQFPGDAANPNNSDGSTGDDGSGVSGGGVSASEETVETDAVSIYDGEYIASGPASGPASGMNSANLDEADDASTAPPVEPMTSTSVPDNSGVTETTVPEQQSATDQTTTTPATPPSTVSPPTTDTPSAVTIDVAPSAIVVAPSVPLPPAATAAADAALDAAIEANEAVAAGVMTIDESTEGLLLLTISPQTPVPAWATPNVNLLTNGGFENGPYKSSSVEHLALPTWTSTSANGTLETWPSGHYRVEAFEGRRLIELNAHAADTITTTVAVTPGDNYVFSFRHRGRDDADTVELLVDGKVLGRVTSEPGGWQFVLVELTAPAKRSSITIGIRAVDEGKVGNLIDDVQLRQSE